MKALSSCGGSVTSGPRLEMFRELVCRSYTAEHIETPGFLSLPSNTTSVASVALNFPATFMEAYLPQNHQAYMSLGTVDMHNVTIVDCASNPHVQADVAKVAAGTWFFHGHALLTSCLSPVITIISGVLSCLTTGWWGGVGARFRLILSYADYCLPVSRSSWSNANNGNTCVWAAYVRFLEFFRFSLLRHTSWKILVADYRSRD